jgi:hypothetical protein
MHFPVSPKHATFHAQFNLVNFFFAIQFKLRYGLPYQVIVFCVMPLGPKYVVLRLVAVSASSITTIYNYMMTVSVCIFN